MRFGFSGGAQGAKFDSQGKLCQWMTDEDIKVFQERGKKLMDQFNKVWASTIFFV